MGMMQAGLHLDLAFEALHLFGFAARTRGQELHRLNSLGDDVLDLVDRPHTTGAGDPDHFVIANYITDLNRQATPPINGSPRKRSRPIRLPQPPRRPTSSSWSADPAPVPLAAADPTRFRALYGKPRPSRSAGPAAWLA